MKHHTPAFLALVEDAKSRIFEITVDDLRRMMEHPETYTLVDVREDREWDGGHVAGAAHLARGIIERDIENVIPDFKTEIILYCGGGYRSAMAADSLQKMGYKNVKSLAGGWTAWLESKGPIEGKRSPR